MGFYFLIFGFIAFISLIDFVAVSKESKLLCSWLGLIVLICFFGFRYDCDNDYNNYVGIYNNTPSLSDGVVGVVTYSFLVGVEVGYCLVSAFFKMVKLMPQSIFIFSAILTFVLMHKCFKRASLYPGLSMLLFFAQFFSLPFIQIRFGIAMGIVLLACLNLFNGKKLRFFLLLFFGCLFHISALGGILVYFFSLFDWKVRPDLLIGILILSISIMLLPIRSFLISLLGIVDIGKYSELYAETGSASPFSVFVTIILILPLIIFRKQLTSKQINVNPLLSMALASIFVGCLVWQLGILNRFSIITASVLCIIIPIYLTLLKRKIDKVIGVILIFGYCLLKFLPNLQHVFPYQTIFTHI